MESTIYLLVSLLAAAYCVSGLNELPDYIHVCSRTVPKMEECLNKSVELIRPHLLDGIPELDIPKLDPIILGDLLISEKNKNGIMISASDVVVQGTTNFRITKIEMIEFAKKYEFHIAIPELYARGRYAFDGTLLLLQLKGSGKFTGNFTDVVGVTTVALEHVPVGDETHIKISKLNEVITVKKGRLNFENLFSGNKEISQVLNDSINENFHVYAKEVIPLIGKSLAKYFKQLGNKVIDRFTVDQLFPQN